MAGARSRFPWLLVAASVLFAALFAYVLFAGYLPAKRRLASLDRELREVYRREAELQTRLAQEQQRSQVRERQLSALAAERQALRERLGLLERQLGVRSR